MRVKGFETVTMLDGTDREMYIDAEVVLNDDYVFVNFVGFDRDDTKNRERECDDTSLGEAILELYERCWGD